MFFLIRIFVFKKTLIFYAFSPLLSGNLLVGKNFPYFYNTYKNIKIHCNPEKVNPEQILLYFKLLPFLLMLLLIIGNVIEQG